MAFLSQDILEEILKTYPGAAAAEEKFKSLQKESKDSFYLKAYNRIKKAGGYNTTEDSEACYFEIKACINEATKNQNIKAWPIILCIAGEAGNHTKSGSPVKSDLCETAFGLLDYILKVVNEKLKTVKKDTALDADQILAIKVKQAIDQRIAYIKKFIISLTFCIDASSDLFADKLNINVGKVLNFRQAALPLIEVSQRCLHYQGVHSHESLKYDPQKENPYIKSPKEIFPNLPFYNSDDQKKYYLTHKKVKQLQLDLPMYLQIEFWPAIHLRNKQDKLKNEAEDSIVIQNIENLVNSRREHEEKGIKELKDAQQSSPVSADSSESLPPPDFDGLVSPTYKKKIDGMNNEEQNTSLLTPNTVINDNEILIPDLPQTTPDTAPPEEKSQPEPVNNALQPLTSPITNLADLTIVTETNKMESATEVNSMEQTSPSSYKEILTQLERSLESTDGIKTPISDDEKEPSSPQTNPDPSTVKKKHKKHKKHKNDKSHEFDYQEMEQVTQGFKLS